MNEQPTPSTATEVITGSTGNGIQDGSFRAAIMALVNGIIYLVSTVVTLDAEQLAAVYALVNPAMLVLFGIFDALRKRGLE